jgi:DNA-binding LytR/AlgR family response regulator
VPGTGRYENSQSTRNRLLVDAALRVNVPVTGFRSRINRIEWIESAGNQVRVHAGARSYLMRVTMDRLEQRLAGRGDFIRVRRSALVNVRAVATLERYAKGMYPLRLTSGATVTSSRYHQAALRELIRNQAG